MFLNLLVDQNEGPCPITHFSGLCYGVSVEKCAQKYLFYLKRYAEFVLLLGGGTDKSSILDLKCVHNAYMQIVCAFL